MTAQVIHEVGHLGRVHGGFCVADVELGEVVHSVCVFRVCGIHGWLAAMHPISRPGSTEDNLFWIHACEAHSLSFMKGPLPIQA